APGSRAHVEPHLVAPDRAAETQADVPEPLLRVRLGDAAGAQRVAQILAVQTLARIDGRNGSVERVAAVLGHDVDVDPAAPGFGGPAAELHDDFLRVQVAGVVPAPVSTGDADKLEAVDRRETRVAAVNRLPDDGLAERAADITRCAARKPIAAHAWNHRAEGGERLAVRQGIEDVAHQHLL